MRVQKKVMRAKAHRKRPTFLNMIIFGKENFKKRKWKTSKNNNSYIKIKNHLIVLYYNKRFDNWKCSIDNVFCIDVYPTREDAMDAAFEALEKKITK